MFTLPLWAIGAGKVAKKTFQAVPIRVWLIISAVIIALTIGYFTVTGYGERKLAEGVAQERAVWEKAQEKADEEQAKRVKKRDKIATGIATDTKKEAAQAVTKTRKESAQAVEKVNHEMSKNPMGCVNPELPASVSDKGREAIERARTAASEM